MNKTHLLFLIILIEGYVVLACELLAIRLLIPFVGSGTETISIIISAVLLPLAVGYHFGGGAFRRNWRKQAAAGKPQLSVRRILLKNILSASVVLALGLSYPFLELFFAALNALGIQHRLLHTAAHALLFLVFPVFTLAQTVPLVSQYFAKRRLSEITGKMLCFSTAGSFLGSVFSTIVLMSLIGVHGTVIVTLALLLTLVPLLSRKLFSYEMLLAALVLGLVFAMNGPGTMRSLNIVSNNAYNLVRVEEMPREDSLILNINRSASSKIAQDPKRQFAYARYLENQFLGPLSSGPPKDILVIGAGGFTIGLKDKRNRYTYIDIDKDLQRVAEAHFLPEPLTPNKQFIAQSARAFVHNSAEQYDFILLDAYTNVVSIPMECITQGFLQDVKQRLKPGGIVVANVISSPSFADKFTVRYDNTFRSVFPHYQRVPAERYAAWPGQRGKKLVNMLYVYHDSPLAEDNGVYTDDKNTYSLDR